MKNKKERKSKALKNDSAKNDCFFKAFFSGVAASVVSLLLLCAISSAIVSGTQDSTKYLNITSYLISALSLIVGGIVCRKVGKAKGITAAFVCGCACLGICYALSVLLKLGGSMTTLNKTLHVAIMLICPLLGAKFGGKTTAVKRRKR